jgi:hypothetical protein
LRGNLAPPPPRPRLNVESSVVVHKLSAAESILVTDIPSAIQLMLAIDNFSFVVIVPMAGQIAADVAILDHPTKIT